MGESAEIQRLLELLERGTNEEQIEARTCLGHIFLEREQWDYAAECLERNYQEGVRTPTLLRDLVRVRIMQGRVEEARALGDEVHRMAELAQSGRIYCAQCGYWSAPTRKTCKDCGAPLDAPDHGQVVHHEVQGVALFLKRYPAIVLGGAILLMFWLWPYLGWGGVVLLLGVWVVLGMVLRDGGLTSR
jgi:hypothetical protein